jgi:hypothetical protein
MKDLIFVTAFCPTEEQENYLEKCIESISNCNAHIALISHTHISSHIQKKCEYYFYDYNNDVSEDYELLGFNSYFFNDKVIQSRFFNKTFYGFAIYRMFSIACQIAINYGYENLHHIEYDCELLDKNLIKENKELLKEYDSVLYTDNGNEDGFLFGSFKSFKVSSLPEKFKNYDKKFINEEMKELEPKVLEFLTKKIFSNSNKVLFRKEPSDKKFKRGPKFYAKQAHNTLFYNPQDKSLNFFYESIKDTSEKIFVIINENKVVTLDTKPHYWHIKPLGNFDEINNIRIDNSEKIIYNINFDKEFKELFKIKSYISEKNN